LTDGRQPAAQEILSVDGLGVQLDGRRILHDVSVHVGAGQFTGLIGSNGAGKTTLFRVILGLTPAAAGEVLIAGRPRSRRNPLIGYVPQKFSLDPDAPLRARDLVALGVDGHRFGPVMPSRRRRAVVDEMLDAVGGRGFADTRVGLLSGGEQQRVLIAHALASRPRLLLLDEPLANLDLRSASEVVALVAGIARRQRLAVLISAHEINPLLPVMDQIVYLAAGRAVQGRTEDVITTEVLSRLYGHHVDVLNVHGRILVVADVGPRALDDDAPSDGAHVQIIA
jgi:zinc/manganese transport system ATP-binding protein